MKDFTHDYMVLNSYNPVVDVLLFADKVESRTTILPTVIASSIIATILLMGCILLVCFRKRLFRRHYENKEYAQQCNGKKLCHAII